METIIYFAKPTSGAPQFLFNSSYRRPRPANNMHAYFFCFCLFIHLYFAFYDDRGEPFCETVYAHYSRATGLSVVLLVSRTVKCHPH